MSEETAIKVQDLCKIYKLYDSPQDRLKESLHPLRKKYHHDFYALNDINFEIKKGETLGIVGRNGSGKSTLLKIIAGILTPTSGTVTVKGHISALLELGAGFNPELTGIENVFFSGTLMGFTREEMLAKVDDILSFADIGEFVRQPVKTYSSGMFIRLAFAVAVSINPEILIIDEALSVGDMAFQRKSFRLIESLLNEGMTFLFVSHSLESIKKICTKALFINHGVQLGFGESKKICNDYEQHLFGTRKQHDTVVAPETQSEDGVDIDPDLLTVNELTYGDGRAEIEEVWLENQAGHRINLVDNGTVFTLKYRVRFIDTVQSPVFAFLIKSVEGISLYGSDTELLKRDPNTQTAGSKAVISFRMTNHLAEGVYFVNCGVRDDRDEGMTFLHRRVDVLMFKSRLRKKSAHAGLVNLDANFSAVAM